MARQVYVAADRLISAPAEVAYRCIADFNQHHARFLPPQFAGFHVEQGGYGAGTVHRFHSTTAGRTREFHMRVAEPQPGRVLTETDLNSTLVTTLTVDPAGAGSHVRIETTWRSAGGIGGFFERLFAPRVLRGVYADELDRLDRYAREQAPAPAGPAAAAAHSAD